jgi:hypothetical protein
MLSVFLLNVALAIGRKMNRKWSAGAACSLLCGGATLVCYRTSRFWRCCRTPCKRFLLFRLTLTTAGALSWQAQKFGYRFKIKLKPGLSSKPAPHLLKTWFWEKTC